MDTSSSSIRPEAAISLFYGDSERRCARAVEQVLAAQIPPQEREFALVRLRGAEATAERLAQEIGSVSLLSPQRVIVVEAADTLPPKVQEAIAPLLTALPAGVAVVFVAGPANKDRPPLAAALNKALAQVGQVVDLSPGRGEEVAAALAEEARGEGKQMARGAAQRLLEMVGGDFDAACRELDKLVLYVGERAEITVREVEEVASASAEGNVFRFADAVGMRDTRQALRLLDDLLPPGSKRGAALPLIGMLARQLRLIWQAQAVRGVPQAKERLGDRLPQEHNYFSATGGRAWMQRNLTAQAAKWRPEELAQAFLLLYETDRQLKGLSDGQLEDRPAMELLLAELGR